MTIQSPNDSTHVTWRNVLLALLFIVFDVAISAYLRLGVGTSLVVAALRCILQLALVATVLEQVFVYENVWGTAGIALLLNLLGAFEVVVNKSQRRYNGMFLSVAIGMVGSTIPIAIIGSQYAIVNEPFWKPIKFIPIVGMLCGNTISGVVVAIGHVLREFSNNREKVEVYLAFGASRMEACRPIIRDALRTALMPSINGMSVLGIISIPGMMTGAILGGSSVEQAAKLQMVIIFMICASTALSTIYTTMSTVLVVVDGEHRIREDRIQEGRNGLERLQTLFVQMTLGEARKLMDAGSKWYSKKGSNTGERAPLLDN